MFGGQQVILRGKNFSLVVERSEDGLSFGIEGLQTALTANHAAMSPNEPRVGTIVVCPVGTLLDE